MLFIHPENHSRIRNPSGIRPKGFFSLTVSHKRQVTRCCLVKQYIVDEHAVYHSIVYANRVC